MIVITINMSQQPSLHYRCLSLTVDSMRPDLLEGNSNRPMLHSDLTFILFIQVGMALAQEVKRSVYKSQGLWFDPLLPLST